jgi:Domain of unknown function (DUF4386)
VTRNANARLAGFAYLFYIAVAFPSMLLGNRATSGANAAEKLASFAQHAGDVRLTAVLTFLGAMSALVLAVTVFALTRTEDPDIAMLGLTCRVAEGITGAISIPLNLGMLWLATATGAKALDPGATQAIGAFVFNQPVYGATFFAVGSTLFSWLLLRGRMIPTWIAWFGVVGSALCVVVLLLQDAGVARGLVTQVVWLPVAVFEISVALWWLTKGDTTPPSAISRS